MGTEGQEAYSRDFAEANFLSAPLTALVPVLIVLFALAFTISKFLAYLERRVAYYATKR